MRDKTEAMALELAGEKLKSLGCRWEAHQIGEFAAEIINAFDRGTSRADLETKTQEGE